MRTRDHDLTVDADMSSYDKVVKLACKPKAAPPKAKVLHLVHHPASSPVTRSSQYLEPIIAATWSDDGAVHDVCKALSPRFREPNAIVPCIWLIPSTLLTCRPGRFQGFDRPAYHDSQRGDRQRSRLLILVRGPTVAQRFSR